jgi:hypothetical protein
MYAQIKHERAEPAVTRATHNVTTMYYVIGKNNLQFGLLYSEK